MEASHRTKGLVRLTMACNERCPFCNVPAEDYPSRPTPREELEAQLQAFVAAGEKTLTISGGEPTLLRARLVELVERARELGIEHVEVQTNAVLITPERAQELAEAGVTSAFVSLLSDRPALHDELAGLDGAFPRCLAGIDACLDAGIAVTLNPVFARQTQDRAPEYVRFVAQRFPRIRHISLSAVQPHGRARDGALLPDYGVLGPGIRAARRAADQHGITLLNPYCGLPICAGWDADLDDVVPDATDGALGLDNHGNKSHGAPCQRCAYRPTCPGAWHLYWSVRGGSGLGAPLEKTPNWTGPRIQDQGPTRWQRMEHGWDRVEPGVTDVALRLDPADRKTLARLRRHRSNLNVTVGLDGRADVDTLRLLEALGVERVVLRSQLPG